MRLRWLLLAALPLAVSAQDDDALFDWLLAPETRSTLNAQVGVSGDARSLAVGYAYDSAELGRFAISANRSDDSGRAGGAGDARQWSASWDSNDFHSWSTGFGLGVRDLAGALDVRDITVSIGWWGSQYALQLKPGYRQLRLNTLRGSRSEHAVSLGAIARLHDLTVGYTGYDYSIDFDRLSALIRHRNRRIPASFLDLVFTLEKRRFSLDYRVPLSNSDIGLRFDRSVSALDDQRLDWVSGYVGFDISPQWDGSLEIGRSAQHNDDAVAVATVGVGYHW